MMKGYDASSFSKNVLNTKNTVNNSPSFTGFSPDKLSGAVQGVGGVLNSFYTKHFMQKVLEINNFSKFLTQTDELIGKDFIKTRVEDFQKLYGEKSSNFIKFNGDKFELYEMNPGGKLLNGLADLPGLLIDIPNAALKGAKKIPVIGKWKAWDSVSNIPLLKNRADKKAAMNIFFRQVSRGNSQFFQSLISPLPSDGRSPGFPAPRGFRFPACRRGDRQSGR